jgi:hypothetical protein
MSFSSWEDSQPESGMVNSVAAGIGLVADPPTSAQKYKFPATKARADTDAHLPLYSSESIFVNANP